MGVRFKNYGVWASFCATIGLLLRIKYPQYLGDWTDFSTVFMTLFVALGILNDPTTVDKGYKDDVK